MTATLPPTSRRVVGPDGYMDLAWYKYFEAKQFELSDVSDTASAASTAASGLTEATGVIPGTYGTTTRVGLFTVGLDGRITSASQSDIAYPGDTIVTQTGWSAYTATTVSNPPTQAEVQALWDDFADLVNALIAANVLDT